MPRKKKLTKNLVYIRKREKSLVDVTTWDGSLLGIGFIIRTWKKYYAYEGPLTFHQLVFKIGSQVYIGRYSPQCGDSLEPKKIIKSSQKLEGLLREKLAMCQQLTPLVNEIHR